MTTITLDRATVHRALDALYTAAGALGHEDNIAIMQQAAAKLQAALEQPCAYPACPYPCMRLPDCKDAQADHTAQAAAWIRPVDLEALKADPSNWAGAWGRRSDAATAPLYTHPAPNHAELLDAMVAGAAATADRTSELEALLAEARDALSDISYRLEKSRVWGGMDWTYHPMHPVKYLPLRDKARATVERIDAALGGKP